MAYMHNATRCTTWGKNHEKFNLPTRIIPVPSVFIIILALPSYARQDVRFSRGRTIGNAPI